MQVRMKHPDPNASSSFVGPKDEHGGVMVEMDMLDVARAHGYFVAHIEHEPALKRAKEVVPDTPERGPEHMTMPPATEREPGAAPPPRRPKLHLKY